MPYEPLDESAYQDAAIRKDAINDASWGVLSALGMLTPFGVGRGAASAAARAVPAYEPGTTLVPSLGASVSQVASRLPAESRGSYEAIYAKAPEFFGDYPFDTPSPMR